MAGKGMSGYRDKVLSWGWRVNDRGGMVNCCGKLGRKGYWVMY